LGTMGYGLPAAMGAKAACPEKLVINVDGDGSLLMNIQEMATCVTHNLPIKVLLLNNMHLGMVMQWEDAFFDQNRAHTYTGLDTDPEWLGNGKGDFVDSESRYPDFIKLAEGFGWQSRRVRKKEDLAAGLTEMIDSTRPYLLEVETPYSPHVLPMIPPGQTVNETLRFGD